MIGAVVLAAGRSTRMGTQKLLLPWRGKPIIAHIVDELLECSARGAARESEGLGVRQSSGAFGPASEELKAPEDWRSPRRKRVAGDPPQIENFDPVSGAANGLHSIIVVVGRDGAQIQKALHGRAVSFVENPDPDGDMLSSVRCGLRVLPASCEGILVALGDQPGLTHELVGDLIQAFHRTGRGIIVP